MARASSSCCPSVTFSRISASSASAISRRAHVSSGSTHLCAQIASTFAPPSRLARFEPGARERRHRSVQRADLADRTPLVADRVRERPRFVHVHARTPFAFPSAWRSSFPVSPRALARGVSPLVTCPLSPLAGRYLSASVVSLN